MSVKEQLVEILLSEGYGIFEACKAAQNIIDEFLNSGKQKDVYYSGTKIVTLERS